MSSFGEKFEAKPTLLERSYFKHDWHMFPVLFSYHTIISTFSTGLWMLFVVCCLLWTLKGHRVVLMNLIVYMHVLFHFHFLCF